MVRAKKKTGGTKSNLSTPEKVSDPYGLGEAQTNKERRESKKGILISLLGLIFPDGACENAKF